MFLLAPASAFDHSSAPASWLFLGPAKKSSGTTGYQGEQRISMVVHQIIEHVQAQYNCEDHNRRNFRCCPRLAGNRRISRRSGINIAMVIEAKPTRPYIPKMTIQKPSGMTFTWAFPGFDDMIFIAN